MLKCPACSVELKLITITHVKSKHPEFSSVEEFKDFYGLNSVWSPEMREQFAKEKTGKSRGTYLVTEAGREAHKLKGERNSGENHWNFGNSTSEKTKDKISVGVKNSESFQQAMEKFQTDLVYREWRLQIINEKVIPKNLKTRASRGLITAFDDKDEWQRYAILVGRYTRKSISLFKDIIDPLNLLNLPNYDLDHKFSKHEGFKLNISPEIIGSPVNLVPLNWLNNRSKGSKCSITLEELMKEFSNFKGFRGFEVGEKI